MSDVKYMGLDVHLRTFSVCVLDAQGKRIDQRTIRGHWTKMLDHLASMDGPLVVCFETSCAYGMMHDRLGAFC